MTVLYKGPCDSCGSSDANAVYEDGHTFCFSCQSRSTMEATTLPPKGEPAVKRINNLVDDVTIVDLPSRGITEATCEKYGYGLARVGPGMFRTEKAAVVQVAPYHDKNGNMVGQKVRRTDEKDFRFLGDSKAATLFGQHLYRPGGKHLTITEGEIDALTMSEIFGRRWAAVSVPNGASGAAESIRANLEYVESFDRVVFMFDNDKPGQDAAIECAQILTPGKAAIANIPGEDVNQAFMDGKKEEILQGFWDATTYRPDGLLTGADLFQQVIDEPAPEFIEWPWAGLQTMTMGIEKGSIVTIAGGPASGKTKVCDELASAWADQGYQVGIISLERSKRGTLIGLLTTRVDIALHLDPEVDLEQYREAWTPLGEKLTVYDHKGTLDAANLQSKIRHMVKTDQCDVVIVDNLSVVITSSTTTNERRLIDEIMQMYVSISGETGCTIINVVHLKRPSEGLGYEQGREATLGDLRGSAMLESFSYTVVAIERNQAGTDDCTSTARLLKCRHTGFAGEADTLQYNRVTGRLLRQSSFE